MNRTFSSYQVSRTILLLSACILTGLSFVGCNSGSFSTTAISLTPSSTQVRAGGSTQFSALRGTSVQTGGTWQVVGGSQNGSIDGTGKYAAPNSVPANSSVTIQYTAGSQSATATASVLNPIPTVNQPTGVIASSVTTIVVTGSGFIPTSQVLVNGIVVPSTFQSATAISVVISISSASTSSVQLQVKNPDPGSALSNTVSLAVGIPVVTFSPATLPLGQVTLTVQGVPFSPAIPPPTLTIDGHSFTTTQDASGTVTAKGYVRPWTNGTATVRVASADGAYEYLNATAPVVKTVVTYDVAARFAMQAGFGPREDVVEHIQNIGLDAFITEQMQQPNVSYGLTGQAPRSAFLRMLVSGNSLLRQRVAWGMNTFLPQRMIEAPFSAIPYELKLETDAFGNFRQVMEDLASDPNVGTFLALPYNFITTPGHPNQNFGREVMQLFTIGPILLNDDGTPQTDGAGNTIPSYTPDTVDAMARAFTGWQYATPVNLDYTAFGIDYTQTLYDNVGEHDSQPKTILGVNFPAGLTATQERENVLDILFNHPNLPPFVCRRLIQRLVKSQPSPAYIGRVVNVFKDDGTGTRGNLAAVIRAILLDPEARQGDATPSPTDGYLQDPLFAVASTFELLGYNGFDDQPSFWPGMLGEDWWLPQSVFSYFSPDYKIPGTNVNSPEFQLMSTPLLVKRSQLLWYILNGNISGLTPDNNQWLYSNFRNVRDIVEALNHALYYGRMPQYEIDSITAYCNTLPDLNSQLESAVFLAINSDNYTVVQ